MYHKSFSKMYGDEKKENTGVALKNFSAKHQNLSLVPPMKRQKSLFPFKMNSSVSYNVVI